MRFLTSFLSMIAGVLLCAVIYMLPLISNAQSYKKDDFSGIISLRSQASILLTGKKDLAFEDIRSNTDLSFVPLSRLEENMGFSNEGYWIRFTLENPDQTASEYYLETARPITDIVDLYLVDEDGEVQRQYSGDKIPFSKKTVAHRKSIFDISLEPLQKMEVYIHLKSDGEVVMTPLQLYRKNTFFELTYKEQVFYGFFYGILILACIIYLFFFFALKDSAFIYYGLYVLFIALMQFSLDGFFHQYFTPQGGWLSERAVLLTAFVSLFFFGKYGDTFLNLKEHNRSLHLVGKLLGIGTLVGMVILCAAPTLPSFCYPLANGVGILVLVHMIISLVVVKVKKVRIDHYFVMGISCLVLGFVIFILNNFNTIENSFFTNNGAKFGIGLEIVFLSISMSNRIRGLRMENEKNQLLALQRAEDMNDIKSSFLSNISHELRTPLNLIMGVATSLQQNKEEADLEEKCKLILSSSKNLLGCIEDILDFTVIEKGTQELKLVSFELPSTLSKVMEAYQKKAEAKNLDFNFSFQGSLPSRIIGDKGKLVQMLNHLLDNAIKFTNTGGITVAISCKNKGKNGVVLDFSIEDTGIGISKEKMSTVFESFTKKSFMDKREFSGLGLGLYIVKNYVDLHEGTIHITNNAQQGTTCELSLGYEMDDTELVLDQNEGMAATDSLGAKDILLVEDNKMNQTVVKLLFKKWEDINLTIANHGKEALEIMKEQTFDLVLMDLQMPEMDGFETTSMIRSGKASCNPQIPILVVTADSTSKTRKEIFRLGANDLISKPINGALLFSKMKKNIPQKPYVA